MNDQELHAHIEALVAEEHTLLDTQSMSATERARLGDINVQLDRLWDLLRQRRAREEFAQNPEDTAERSSQTVESYLQ